MTSAANEPAQDFPLQNLPFKTSNSSFVYLGIHICDTLDNLYTKICFFYLQKLHKTLNDSAFLICPLRLKYTLLRFIFSLIFSYLPANLSLSLLFQKVDFLVLALYGMKKSLGGDVRFSRDLRHWVGWCFQKFCFIMGSKCKTLKKLWLQYKDTKAPLICLVTEADSASLVNLKALLH